MTTTTERFRPRLRPLSLGEILDVAIKICLSQRRTLIKAVLVVHNETSTGVTSRIPLIRQAIARAIRPPPPRPPSCPACPPRPPW